MSWLFLCPSHVSLLSPLLRIHDCLKLRQFHLLPAGGGKKIDIQNGDRQKWAKVSTITKELVNKSESWSYCSMRGTNTLSNLWFIIQACNWYSPSHSSVEVLKYTCIFPFHKRFDHLTSWEFIGTIFRWIAHLYHPRQSSWVHPTSYVHRVTPYVVLRFLSTNNTCYYSPVIDTYVPTTHQVTYK